MNKSRSLNNIISQGLLGIVIGTTIELVFSAIFSSPTVYSPGVPSFLAQFSNIHLGVFLSRLIYFGLGVVSGLSSYLYDQVDENKISLLKASLIHYASLLVVLLGLGVFFHWYNYLVPLQILGFVGSYTVIWGIIWLIVFLVTRSQIQKMNKKLEK